MNEAETKIFIDEDLENFELNGGEGIIVFQAGERPPLPVQSGDCIPDVE